jgi:hypothetical protein
MKTRELPLSEADLESLDYVYGAFVDLGPAIDYAGFQTTPNLTTGNLDFSKLTLVQDGRGRRRSFLGSDELFQVVKSMHERNLIVPVQGDFGGPRTLRAIGEYLRSRNLVLNAFYISNVEQYLFGNTPARFKDTDANGGWRNFYRNLAALPADASSVLVRSAPGLPRLGPPPSALCALQPFLVAVDAGRVTSQTEARRCTY